MDIETARQIDMLKERLDVITRVVGIIFPIQFRLPSVGEAVGKLYVVKNYSTTTTTNVVTTGSDTFLDTGTGSITLAPLQAIRCYSGGNFWVLL
jgi:hypothetical protein